MTSSSRPTTLRPRCLAAAAACLLSPLLLTTAHSAAPNSLLLNEYNAVDSTKYLDASTYAGSTKEDTYLKTLPGLNNDGRIQGNGGNWLELVVTQDHLNIQGWSLRWVATDNAKNRADQADKINDYWYGSPNYEQGIITFSPVVPLWSDLRAGTIITLSQKQSVAVGTDDAGNHNATKSLVGDPYATIDLSTDTSYNPAAGDWWIHLCTSQEQTASQFVTTVTNVKGDKPGDFSVGPYDWQMRVLDNQGTLVFGPVGETIPGWGGDGIDTKSMGKLEANPSFNITLADYASGTSSTFGSPNIWTPAGSTITQDFSALRSVVVPEPSAFAGLLLLCTAGLRRPPRRRP